MKNKKKMTTSNKILITSVIAIIIFTVAAFILQFKTGTEISSTLVERWFTFWTAEVVVLAGIKVTKVFKNYYNCGEEEE